jgi:hypothetical protein
VARNFDGIDNEIIISPLREEVNTIWHTDKNKQQRLGLID